MATSRPNGNRTVNADHPSVGDGGAEGGDAAKVVNGLPRVAAPAVAKESDHSGATTAEASAVIRMCHETSETNLMLMPQPNPTTSNYLQPIQRAKTNATRTKTTSVRNDDVGADAAEEVVHVNAAISAPKAEELQRRSRTTISRLRKLVQSVKKSISSNSSTMTVLRLSTLG
jgi:hypothetical protein